MSMSKAKCEGGNTTLDLSQKRYLATPAQFDAANDQLWQIPVCVKGINGSSAGPQECFVLTKREDQFKMKGCSNFVFPDANALGYYRFSYDTAACSNWATRWRRHSRPTSGSR